MTKQKFTVSFVNKGKPFEMPNWTPEKHEAALAKLAKAQKENNWDDMQANNEFKYYIIHETLLEIDTECEIEDVKKLHPETTIQLFKEVYHAGKENIYYDENLFRKRQSTRKSKK